MFALFFFTDSAPSQIYTLSLHDALPISHDGAQLRVGIGGIANRCARRGRVFRRPRTHSADMDRPIPTDRKSTRLNSSHANISYAVFCLKKTKKVQCGAQRTPTRRSTMAH